jgi:hypothetical protein
MGANVLTAAESGKQVREVGAKQRAFRGFKEKTR